MNAIIMVLTPKECSLLFNGSMSKLVRKNMPKKLSFPFKVYVYQKKHKGGKAIINEVLNNVYGGGKVIGEFICELITDIAPVRDGNHTVYLRQGTGCDRMSFAELHAYLGGKLGKDLHITAPKRYDEPKELSEFRKPDFFRDCEKDCCKNCDMEYYRCPTRDSRKASTMAGYCRKKGKTLTRPPQGWCYVEEIEE